MKDEELKLLKEETEGRPLRISFDETTIRYVVLCVIAAFVDKNGKMQQRIIKVALYNEPPEEKFTNTMSDHILTAIEGTLGTHRSLIKVFTRDGVALNEMCIAKLAGGVITDPDTKRETVFRGIYPESINIKCMSHTLDLCGAEFTVRGVKHSRIEGPNARKLYNEINGLFSGPGDSTKLTWAKYSGSSMPSVSQTRWWSREEFWAYLLPFLKDHIRNPGGIWFDEWICERLEKMRVEKKSIGAHYTKLEQIFVQGTRGYDEIFLVTAFVEIAVVVDISKKVREATYLVEGDGPIAVIIIEILDSVARYFRTTYADMEFPNVRRHIAQAVELGILPPGYVPPAVVRVEGAPQPQPLPPPMEAADNPIVPLVHNEDAAAAADPLDVNIEPLVENQVAWDLEQAWKNYCTSISQPFMTYFDTMVMDHNCLPFWEAASMADPLNMQRKTITPAYLRETITPLMDKLATGALVDRMIAELSEYEKACSNLDWTNDSYQVRLVKVEAFWSSHKLLPGWTEFAHLVFLLQPSSACVERSFSILKYIMTDQQTRSLRDKIEASLMLRFNRGSK